ncbi:MAG: hypothetical protein HY901_17930, partial [Deltaproteobacteria bacterium]|nr:hypothetical protein [Deltaproteobacteria bacterium]
MLVAALAVGGCKDEPTPPSFATIPLRLGDGGFVRPDLGDAGRAHVIVDPLDPESLYLAAQEAFIAGEFEKAA